MAIAIFDSHATPHQASALYLSAVAQAVEDGIETFSARSLEQGLPAWTRTDVTAPARLRLYRARGHRAVAARRG